jgi:hypothetical protein
MDDTQFCLNCFTRVEPPVGGWMRCPECNAWCVSEKKAVDPPLIRDDARIEAEGWCDMVDELESGD